MKHILIISEEADTLAMIVAALKQKKFKPETAVSAPLAAQFLRNRRVDLVIMDCTMQHGSPDDVIAALQTTDTPLLLLVEPGEEPPHTAAQKCTAQLGKPFSMKKLLAAIEDISLSTM